VSDNMDKIAKWISMTYPILVPGKMSDRTSAVGSPETRDVSTTVFPVSYHMGNLSVHVVQLATALVLVGQSASQVITTCLCQRPPYC
jgi:hypothetical protein